MTEQLTLPPTVSFDWETRKIPEATIRRYKVGCTVDDTSIVFPCYDEAQGLIGYSQRALGDGTRKHTTRGPVCLFGIQACKPNGTLYICEGQTDTLALSSIYPADSVVGIPGASTAKACAKRHASWLRRFQSIYIVMDGDDPGRQAANDLRELLPAQRVKTVTVDEGMDVSEYLMNDRVDDLKRHISMAVSASSSLYLTMDDLAKIRSARGELTVISTGLPDIDAMLGGGLKPAELVGLAGYTGQGKSSLAQVITVNVAQQGHKVIYVSDEMSPDQTVARLTEIWYGSVNIPTEVRPAYEAQVLDMVLIRKTDDTNAKAMNIDVLADDIKDTILDHDVKLVVLDVLSDIDKFNASDSEYNTHIMKTLQEIANGNAVTLRPPTTVLCVCHTAGSNEDEAPTAAQIRGGTVVRQIMTSILTVLTDLDKEETTVYLRKHPRNSIALRKHPITYSYSSLNRNYTVLGGLNATTPRSKQRKKVSESVRGTLPVSAPTSSVPSEGVVPLGGTTEGQALPSVDQASEHRTDEPAELVGAPLQPGLRESSDGHLLRDQGTDEDSGPAEVQGGDSDTLNSTVSSSGTSTETLEVRSAEPGIDTTQQGPSAGELSDADRVVRNMYLSQPHRLANDRALSNVDEQIRTRLVRLGLAP